MRTYGPPKPTPPSLQKIRATVKPRRMGAREAVRGIVESERPFHPEGRRESWAQPHHFAVNAAPAVSDLLREVDSVVDEDGDDTGATAAKLRSGDYVFAWQVVGEGQLALRGMDPGRSRLVIAVAGNGELDQDAAAKAAAMAAVTRNVRTPPTWEIQLGDEADPEVTKYVMSSEHAADMSYEDFQAADLEKLFGAAELTAAEAATILAEELKEEGALDALAEAGDDEDAQHDAIVEYVKKHGRGDNTYNWSWWGPTLNFYEVGGDVYDQAVFAVRSHGGGDPRGNYGSWQLFAGSPSDTAPWYTWQLYVDIRTAAGTVSLNAEDTEAYHWIVTRDETGTFKEDANVKSDDIEEAFGVDIWR